MTGLGIQYYDRGGLNFRLTGVLEVSRELGAMARKLPTIQRRAIATMRRRLPVEARRDIQAEYNISAGRVRKDLSTTFLPDGVRLIGHFRGIGLMQFSARKGRTGTSAEVFRGKRKIREGTFIAGLFRGDRDKGNVHVVERDPRKRIMTAGRYTGKLREPLVTRYGPTVAQMLRKGRRPERLTDFARGVLRSEVDRQLKSLSTTRPSAGT